MHDHWSATLKWTNRVHCLFFVVRSLARQDASGWATWSIRSGSLFTVEKIFSASLHPSSCVSSVLRMLFAYRIMVSCLFYVVEVIAPLCRARHCLAWEPMDIHAYGHDASIWDLLVKNVRTDAVPFYPLSWCISALFYLPVQVLQVIWTICYPLVQILPSMGTVYYPLVQEQHPLS